VLKPLALDRKRQAIPAAIVPMGAAGLAGISTFRHNRFTSNDRTDQEYLAIDSSTSIWPLHHEQLSSIVADAVDSDYEVVCAKGPTVVLERGSKPAAQSWTVSR
jgi:hypothetical protein